MKRIATFGSALATCFCMGLHAQVNIAVDVAQRGIEISPTLYGIFYEDINFASDGGLYAELIRNRSFEYNAEKPEHWQARGSNISLVTEGLLNEKQGHALRVETTEPFGGISNPGYWGINAVQGTQYRLSFWIKPLQGKPGSIRAALTGKDGELLGESTVREKLGKGWQKIETTLIAKKSDGGAHFSLTMENPSTVLLDVVSLFPPTFKGRENGCRIDLAEKLQALHPAFMRFPGGCYVEGNIRPENAYHWERTVGPIEQRPGHMNANWGYPTTDGLGFHEFLQLAEDLGAKPLYVVNVGIWHGGCTPLDELQPWIDECLGALEYANGPVTSHYGKMRAENGHPEPFNIAYIEIGNENYNWHMEDNSDQSDHYPERYRMFYDAIKARFPQVQCIGNVESWGTDTPKWRNSHPVDILDEHYYRNPKWFAEAYHKYDNYDRRGPSIYVGEYAVTSQFGKVGNQNAALGEAVYMLGMENNADIVTMASYAPIFVNDNASNWPTDMIHFNADYAFGTPSYWVQNLFSNNVGTRTVPQTLKWNLPEPKVVEASHPLHVGVGTWATRAEYKEPQLIVEGKTYDLPDIQTWQSNRGREPHMEVCPVAFEGKSYTYKVKARKKSGAEGFLLVYNYQNDRDFDWFNVAGWGNTQNCIEQSVDGGRMNISETVPFKVETDRWYDLQVNVTGDSVAAFIDGQLQFTARHKNPNMRGVFSNSTLDERTNTLYVKVVNVGEGATQGCINLAGGLAERATMVRLAGESGQSENTRINPLAIHPLHVDVFTEASGRQVNFPVAPFSVNIITIKLK